MITILLCIACATLSTLVGLIVIVVINSIRDGSIGWRKPNQPIAVETDWRVERRHRRLMEARDWDRRYRQLLPPEPPCTSTEHDHDEIVTWGGATVARVCHKDHS